MDFQVELYRPNKSKQKSEIKKTLSNNSTEMVKLNKKMNLKSEKINSSIPNSLSLPSLNKEIKI
jgi:hypothetical protein